MVVINQMWVNGDNVDNQRVVAKVLRSLTSQFEHVVAVIEEFKDLTQLTVHELSGSLQDHEVRMNKSAEKLEGS